MSLFILHMLILYSLSDSFSMISRSGSPSCFFRPLILTPGETMWMRDLGKINLPCHQSALTSLSPFCLIAHRSELSFPGREKWSKIIPWLPGDFLSLKWTCAGMGTEQNQTCFFHVLKVTLLHSPPSAHFLQMYYRLLFYKVGSRPTTAKPPVSFLWPDKESSSLSISLKGYSSWFVFRRDQWKKDEWKEIYLCIFLIIFTMLPEHNNIAWC